MPSALSNFKDLPVIPMAGLLFVLAVLLVGFFSSENPRTRKIVGGLLGAVTIGFIGWILALTVLRPKSDINVVGGCTFTLRVESRTDDNDQKIPLSPEDVANVVQTIKHRLDASDTKDFEVTRQGNDRIIVQIPGVKTEETAAARKVLEKTGDLALREVSPRSEDPGADGKTLAQRVQEGSEIIPGYKAHTLKHKDENGKEFKRPILLSRRAGLTGTDIASVSPSLHQTDAVEITLNSAGADKMIAFTKVMRPGRDRIAIVLDGEVISAPVVNQVPLGKQFIIEGLREPGEVQTLACALMNPLESPLILEEVHTVAPRQDFK